jgi:hypothetical protein
MMKPGAVVVNTTEENYRAFFKGAVEAIEAYLAGAPIRQLHAD